MSYCTISHGQQDSQSKILEYDPNLSEQVRYDVLLDQELVFDQSKRFLNDEQLYFCHRLMISYFSDKQDNSRALLHGFEALKMSYRLDNVKKQAESHLKIANIELTVQNADEAILSAQNAIEAYTILGDSISLVASYNALGNSYLAKGEFSKSLAHYYKSLKIARIIGDVEMQMYPVGNLGAYYLFQKRPDSALVYIDQVLEFDRHMRSQGSLAMAYGNKAYAYILKEDFQLAEAYFDSSFTIALNNDLRVVLLNLYKDRSEMYLAKGDYESSYKDLIRYQCINDSLKYLGSSMQVSEWKEAYANDEKKRAMLKERTQYAQLIHTEEIQTYVNWIITIVLIFFTISVLLLFWRYRTKALNVKKLNDKDVEMEQMALRFSQKGKETKEPNKSDQQ